MSSFKLAPVTDVNYAWGYISALLRIDRVKQGLLEPLLSLLKVFPFDKISPESQKEVTYETKEI